MYEIYEEPEPEPTVPEVIIGNILKAVVCIFLIVIGVFIVLLVTTSLSGQTAVEYETYTREFQISAPLSNPTIYTSNSHLSSIIVSKYNSSNSTWAAVPPTDWSFHSQKALINISGLEHTISTLKVEAETTYAEPPVLSIMTMWSILLIIASIMATLGFIAYHQYKKQNRPPYIQ